jgi:hypothetical protein
VETNVEESLEGTAGIVTLASGLGQGVLTVRLLNTLEILIELELLQNATSEEETDSVASRPVGETILNAVSLELVSICSSVHLVASKLSGDELADDVAVCEADDQAILGSVVLVLGLGDEALASVVVGLEGISFNFPSRAESFD